MPLIHKYSFYSLLHKQFAISKLSWCGFSTAAEHMPHYPEVMGSTPAGCWAFFYKRIDKTSHTSSNFFPVSYHSIAFLICVRTKYTTKRNNKSQRGGVRPTFFNKNSFFRRKTRDLNPGLLVVERERYPMFYCGPKPASTTIPFSPYCTDN